MQAYYYLSDMLARSNRLIEAEEGYRRVLELDPGHLAAHLDLGRLYGQLDRHQDAADILRRAIDLDPRAASARYLLGQAYQQTGRRREAEVELAAFRRLSTAQKHFDQGAIFAKRGEWEQAITSWTQAVAVDTSLLDAYLRMGQTLMRQKMPEKSHSAVAASLASRRQRPGYTLYARRGVADG